MTPIVSQSVYELVHSAHTISSLLSQGQYTATSASTTEAPTSTSTPLTVERAVEVLYSNSNHTYPKHHVVNLRVCEREMTKEDLDRVADCGMFTSGRPSDLFLKMYGEVLRTYDIDPLANLVSPSLGAGTGVIPLTILSLIPDIMKHYAECIVRADKEVFFATNYWEASAASSIVSNALKELSRRAGESGRRVVVKIMYDRGNIKQLCDPHQIVPVAEYTGSAVRLPRPDEIPNLDMEVCNYHQPLLGTFHAKYAVIDRKIALLSSNNTQDRVNMEMMTHIEGPIVDAFYEMALLSWAPAELDPPLPLLRSFPSNPPLDGKNYKFGHEHLWLGYVYEDMDEDGIGNSGMARDERLARITKRLNTTLQPEMKPTLVNLDEIDLDSFNPYIIHTAHAPCPMAMVNRRPSGGVGYKDTNSPQDIAWLAGLGYARKIVFIQTPTFNAPPVVEAALDAVRRGVEVVLFVDLGYNDGGEALPLQGGTNEVVVQKMYAQLAKDEEDGKARSGLLKVHWYTAKDMIRPVNASRKMRNCHVKLMIVDGRVGIMGNGNQDSQSWFHSQEANVMVDSAKICKEWMDAIKANQNTHMFGSVDPQDGIWRDPRDGSLLEDMGSTKGGIGAVAKGLIDAVKRVQGKGGF